MYYSKRIDIVEVEIMDCNENVGTTYYVRCYHTTSMPAMRFEFPKRCHQSGTILVLGSHISRPIRKPRPESVTGQTGLGGQ
jgi:hypothetical protein